MMLNKYIWFVKWMNLVVPIKSICIFSYGNNELFVDE